MFKWIEKLLGIDRLKQLQQQVQQLEQQKEEVVASLSSANKDLTIQVEALQQKVSNREDKINSNEPWIEIVSDQFVPDQGIRIALDWNKAFIDYLKENGFQGTNDEEVVRIYLAFLYRDIIEKFEAKQMMEKEQSHQPTIRDE